jgi:hypothetical protein
VPEVPTPKCSFIADLGWPVLKQHIQARSPFLPIKFRFSKSRPIGDSKIYTSIGLVGGNVELREWSYEACLDTLITLLDSSTELDVLIRRYSFSEPFTPEFN